MIWLTWRQFRAAATAVFAALGVLAILLALPGPGLADNCSDGIAACTAQGGECSDFARRFFDEHEKAFLGVSAVALLLPAVIGLFWGAPPVARELEAGTHRLVWNQSITRTRWLAVKLGLVGLAATTAAGVGTLAVTWWASPIDRTADGSYARISPLLFAARGIVPVGYAAFAFVLGVTAGLLIRRTLPAMAVALAAFVAVQIAMPLLVRPHLAEPVRSNTEISESNFQNVLTPQDGGSPQVTLGTPQTEDWILSTRIVDASGGAPDAIALSPSGACGQHPDSTPPVIEECFAEINRLGYRQQVTYHPASRFWPFQWYETGIYAALTLALAGLSFRCIRRRLS
ncbi:Transporter [Parafrankia sp. Ea1.12]|uniref:ABC transporter permease n=1 Tax=Parafrankia sp. Ea1.12 TaxID=573499 RepID=UPI000DA5BB91|nr:ABC transporter permease [Parafrankia sp. Ea1.12]SQD98067.1 Transporter [Parafrankia sp. Ea1.12]